jgi:uncharacterized protein
MKMGFDLESMKDVLVCPKSQAELVMDGDRLVCVDPDIRLAYPIRDDIPIMLIDDAEELSVEDWKTIMKNAGRNPESGQTE